MASRLHPRSEGGCRVHFRSRPPSCPAHPPSVSCARAGRARELYTTAVCVVYACLARVHRRGRGIYTLGPQAAMSMPQTAPTASWRSQACSLVYQIGAVGSTNARGRQLVERSVLPVCGWRCSRRGTSATCNWTIRKRGLLAISDTYAFVFPGLSLFETPVLILASASLRQGIPPCAS